MEIRPFQPGQDDQEIAALWRAALPTWPIAPTALQALLAPDPAQRVLVACKDGRLAGLVVAQGADGGEGHLSALMVAPDLQRRGIGSALHAAALESLRALGVRRVQLGGGRAYQWPGVPYSLPAALAFFQACGWRVAGVSYDMVQHLAQYHTPPGVHERAQGVEVTFLTEREAPALLAVVDREFPCWSTIYRQVVSLGEWRDILVARDRQGALVGSLVLYAPGYSRPERDDGRWRAIWGDDLGALGVVGVVQSARRLGIGSSLVARASEILRERGVGYCYVPWTWALDFYGKLGYKVWQAYAMSWREVSCAGS